MTAAELQARLDKVNDAIDRILDGAQSVTIGSRSYTEVDLKFLKAWGEELETRIEKQSRGGMVTAYGIPTG